MATAEVWHIRRVNEKTKQLLRVYAAENNISIAEALNRLVVMALKKDESK